MAATVITPTAASGTMQATAATADEEVKRIETLSSSSSSPGHVSTFWREKYEKDARRYWDIFYKRHKNKFFKDRHYLHKEWGRYFQVQDGRKLVLLEVGCGAGNAVFPLVFRYPDIFVHACDFSQRAIELVKAHKDFSTDQINAFVCDFTMHNLDEILRPSSVDIVTMIFVLSAVSPQKMALVLQNIRAILKPGSLVLFRDYAVGDLAEERFASKEQKISENYYVRGDGTTAYYFANDFLTNLYEQNGFETVEVEIVDRQIENRSRQIVMNRRWIQAVFSVSYSGGYDLVTTEPKPESLPANPSTNDSAVLSINPKEETDVDMSDSITKLFGSLPPADEVIEIKAKKYNFRIKLLPREHQHTCRSTGLMLWESSRLMCSVLAENPSITAGQRVLELGCGSAGICSMVAASNAEIVVATDGDPETLRISRHNVNLNLEPDFTSRMFIKKLTWGDREDIDAVNHVCGYRGFDIILGTDVTYNPDAIAPLFQTAKELISCGGDTDEKKPTLILCYIERRVCEETVLSTGAQFGFKLVDKWSNGMDMNSAIVNTWFPIGHSWDGVPGKAPLTIMLFHH